MLLAIDPGTNFCGVTFCSQNNGILQVHHSELINVSYNPKTDQEKLITNKYGLRFLKIERIITKLQSIIQAYSISAIAIEGPFYSALRPQAHSALVEVVYAIKSNIAYPLDIPMTIVEPLLVKKHFALKHMAKKEEMLTALHTRIANSTVTPLISIDTLSEHEIDAIAIAYTYYAIQQEINNATPLTTTKKL